jgi:hypothetical protein
MVVFEVVVVVVYFVIDSVRKLLDTPSYIFVGTLHYCALRVTMLWCSLYL